MYVGVHSTQMEQKTMELNKNRCCWIIPPKKTLLRTNASEKIPEKNPAMDFYKTIFLIVIFVFFST